MKKEDDNNLIRRAMDVIQLTEKYASVRTSMFLDPKEQRIIIESPFFRKNRNIRAVFFGGYPNAERKVLAALPEWASEQDIPVALLEITGRYQKDLSHRDFLGAVLGLGLRREVIGDILVSDEATYIFSVDEMADYIVKNLTKIGSVGVSARRIDISGISLPEPKYQEIVGSVASLRLDAVVALFTRASRSEVQKLIESERVSLNYEVALSASQSIKENDRISVRGFGKMKLGKMGGQSKKGRQFVTIFKYV